jgi:hypothetical protein
LDLDKIALKYKANSEVLQLTQSLKHQHHEQLFTILEETLINLDEDIYSTILTLLTINLTLPVTVRRKKLRLFTHITKKGVIDEILVSCFIKTNCSLVLNAWLTHYVIKTKKTY